MGGELLLIEKGIEPFADFDGAEVLAEVVVVEP